MNRLKTATALCVSILALFWLENVLIGLLLATMALALAIPHRLRPAPAEIVVLVWSSLVMMTYSFAHLELWRRLLIALVLRTEETSYSLLLGD